MSHRPDDLVPRPRSRPPAVRVLVSRVTLGLDAALALDRTAFTSEWGGAPLGAPVSYAVAVDPVRVYLVAACGFPPDHDRSLPRGAFAAGLWERDVAELFVGAAGARAYRELNLSPGGAWWTCAFSGYRRPAAGGDAPVVDVATAASSNGRSWTAALAFPRSALPPGVRFDRDTRLAVCMIVGGRARRHLCSRPAPGAPDFHLRAVLAPVEPIPV